MIIAVIIRLFAPVVIPIISFNFLMMWSLTTLFYICGGIMIGAYLIVVIIYAGPKKLS